MQKFYRYFRAEILRWNKIFFRNLKLYSEFYYFVNFDICELQNSLKNCKQKTEAATPRCSTKRCFQNRCLTKFCKFQKKNPDTGCLVYFFNIKNVGNIWCKYLWQQKNYLNYVYLYLDYAVFYSIMASFFKLWPKSTRQTFYLWTPFLAVSAYFKKMLVNSSHIYIFKININDKYLKDAYFQRKFCKTYISRWL